MNPRMWKLRYFLWRLKKNLISDSFELSSSMTKSNDDENLTISSLHISKIFDWTFLCDFFLMFNIRTDSLFQRYNYFPNRINDTMSVRQYTYVTDNWLCSLNTLIIASQLLRVTTDCSINASLLSLKSKVFLPNCEKRRVMFFVCMFVSVYFFDTP